MQQQIHLFIRGLVQGVCYRATTAQRAQTLGLCGWVRNLPDGRVELLAQGDEKTLGTLLAWAEQGPPQARVDHVDAHWSRITETFSDFHIRG